MKKLFKSFTKFMTAFAISILIAILTILNIVVQKSEQDKKDKEIKLQQEENLKLQTKLSDQITGGNNVPYIQVLYRSGGISVLATNKGLTPIYDLKIELYKNDREPFRDSESGKIIQIHNPFRSPAINLGLNESQSMYNINFKNVKQLHHSLNIRWRNGWLELDLNLKNEGKEIVTVTVLYLSDSIPIKFYKDNLMVDYNQIKNWEIEYSNVMYPI